MERSEAKSEAKSFWWCRECRTREAEAPAGQRCPECKGVVNFATLYPGSAADGKVAS